MSVGADDTRADDRQRETPLGLRIKERLRREGPIGVDAYMQMCLGDPEHGYYRRRPALGTAGDFITAPEISQVFGELIGLWCAVVWQQMGSPARVNLVELGPGRGTMMRDALRAAKIVPGFLAALTVHLVDKNETLRSLQQTALADAGVPLRFHSEPSKALTMRSEVAESATIVLANEFLDALPVEQSQFADGAWRARDVGIEGDAFCFKADMSSSLEIPSLPKGLEPREGDVLEVSVVRGVLASTLLKAGAAMGPLAALFIDYGHARTGFGDTLQGVARQAHVSPFHAPGETDLSAQVDFQHFADACRAAELAVDGPLPQAEFLGRLCIVERASRLMEANPSRAAEIEAGVARLIAPSGMGSRFLAIGVRSPSLAPLPGLT
ncbi:MAG: class I SAM-dependent methyltransferase [Hyphomicrobium sp.]|uniref:class I SAM-dependent methyltransferase n=1 Tax=Hyphomicrobium sp. TaxID=82 RepID=UPI003D11E8BC